MSKKLNIISLFLCFIILLPLVLTACDGETEETIQPTDTEVTEATEATEATGHIDPNSPIINNGDGTVTLKLNKFAITYDKDNNQTFVPSVAKAFHTRVTQTCEDIDFYEDVTTNDYEILFGKCNRTEYKKPDKEFLFRDFSIYLVGNKLSVSAFSIYGYERAIEFLVKGFDDNGITLSSAEVYSEYDYGNDDFAAILKNYENSQLDGAWTVNVCHRGDVTTNQYPENSIPSFQSCIDNKIDVIEIDVRKTKDGMWVLCHDDTLNRTTTGAGKVSEYTYQQLLGFSLKTQNGGALSTVTEYKIPSFDEVISLCNRKALLNLDKINPDNFQEIYDIFEEYDALNIAMFKSGSYSAEELTAWFCELIVQGRDLPLFSPLIYSNLKDQIVAYRGLVSMVETDRNISSTAIELTKTIRIRPMCLSTNVGNYESIDNIGGWNLLIKQNGFTAIMTDAPKELQQYIHGNK